MSEDAQIRIPQELPVLPVRNAVVYPFMWAPLAAERPGSVAAIDVAMSKERILAVFLQKDPAADSPRPEDLHQVGTAVIVLKMMKMPDGSAQLIVQGVSRIKALAWDVSKPHLMVTIEPLIGLEERTVEVQALMNTALNLFQRIVNASPHLPDEAYATARSLEEPGKLADFIASNLANIETEQRQQLLALADPKARLEQLMPIANREAEILELTGKIHSATRQEIDKAQRDYFLRQQLREIQKELGEEDERTVEINELKEKIEAAKMPEEAKKAAEKELDRLSKMPPAAAEYTVSRTYLDWLVTLPWSVSVEGELDIAKAAQVLDDDHYDLRDVKDRILEYLAIRKLKKDVRGAILCFVGPPGVGKTSLGQSIARALDRKFVRMSLGGMRDEAEIRGHRRTYIGSLPGRIIQGIRNAGSNNPVYMLDEIDKVGTDFRGDPSSALLEVLDPEQNNTFVDHYLDVPFDLSNVMFIATANILDPVPPALRDRMETLTLPGYTEEEKVRIAKRYLIPRQLENHGLRAGLLSLSDPALRKIIQDHTREAGLRNLDREIARICRKVGRWIAEGHEGRSRVSVRNLHEYLGPEKFYSETAGTEDRVGVATGLAWTPSGGDILFVETVRMEGKRELTLTGQLGDVMRESAQAALSCLRSHAQDYGIDPEAFSKSDVHVHVPAGATPKDGPSAGIAITAALASLFTGRPVCRDMAMTGEITLTGRVLPVGGIKEKALAARRSGIFTVVLPVRNEKDLEDIPEEFRHNMKFVFVDDIHQVLNTVLKPAPA